jgi:hypothetical protein
VRAKLNYKPIPGNKEVIQIKMNKSLLIAALALAAGLFGARTASAQGTAGGTVTVTALGVLESSMFNVLATQNAAGSDLWNVAVSWNKDTSTFFGQSVTVDEVQVGFFNTAGKLQGIATVGAGGTGTAYDPSSSSNSTVGNWSDPKSNKGEIEQGSSFAGSVTLSGASNPVYSVEFALNGGSWNTFVDPPSTPEGQSLALLLPGLIPLAIMVKRRRRA